MKKIYLVITSYFPTPESWRCAFIYDQVKTIQRLSQYQVVVVNTDVINDYVYNGVNVIAFKPWRRGLLIFPWLIEWINTRRLLKTLMLHGISLNDVMVVHTHLVPNAYLGKGLKKINANIKTMIQFHDADPFAVLQSERFNFFGLKRIAYFLYHRSLVESTDACVSISKNVTKVALECPRQNVYTTYEPVKKAQRDLRFCRSTHIHKLILLHNGVDTHLFNKGVCSREKISKEFVMGAIGNFRNLKGYMTLFKALLNIKDKLGDWRMRIIGSGETLGECKDFVFANKMSEYVEFNEEISHDQLPDFYRSLDLFVLPSYFEGFGCVFLEAWACGVPFITCEGQGMDDMIYTQDKRLWLCKECNPEDLSKKILYFYKNRPVQQLCCDIDIETLIREFLLEIKSL